MTEAVKYASFDKDKLVQLSSFGRSCKLTPIPSYNIIAEVYHIANMHDS